MVSGYPPVRAALLVRPSDLMTINESGYQAGNFAQILAEVTLRDFEVVVRHQFDPICGDGTKARPKRSSA